MDRSVSIVGRFKLNRDQRFFPEEKQSIETQNRSSETTRAPAANCRRKAQPAGVPRTSPHSMMRVLSTAALIARQALSRWQAAWEWMIGPVEGEQPPTVQKTQPPIQLKFLGCIPKLWVQCPTCNKLGRIPGEGANWTIVSIPNRPGRAYCDDCGPTVLHLPQDEYRRRVERTVRWELRYANAASN